MEPTDPHWGCRGRKTPRGQQCDPRENPAPAQAGNSPQGDGREGFSSPFLSSHFPTRFGPSRSIPVAPSIPHRAVAPVALGLPAGLSNASTERPEQQIQGLQGQFKLPCKGVVLSPGSVPPGSDTEGFCVGGDASPSLVLETSSRSPTRSVISPAHTGKLGPFAYFWAETQLPLTQRRRAPIPSQPPFCCTDHPCPADSQLPAQLRAAPRPRRTSPHRGHHAGPAAAALPRSSGPAPCPRPLGAGGAWEASWRLLPARPGPSGSRRAGRML